MKILDRYILRIHAGPLFFAFFTVMFVFILTFIAQIIDHVVGKGLAFTVVVEMILLQSAWMVGLAIPMSILVATVMAFGSITNNSELTVMRSSGISMYRLILPVLAIGVVLSVIVERFNNVVVPEANFRARALLADITRTKPSFGLTENAFSDVINGYAILVRKIDPDTQELRGVVLYDKEREGVRTVVTAAKGQVGFTPDDRYLILTLDNGEIHELQMPGMEKYRRVSFVRHRFVFESTGYGFERTDEQAVPRGDQELSASRILAVAEQIRLKIADSERSAAMPLEALGRQVERTRQATVPVHDGNWPDRKGQRRPPGVKAGQAEPDPGQRRARAIDYTDRLIERLSGDIDALKRNRMLYNSCLVEYHKKYSLACACIAFVLVGAPLGVMARRGGLGAGAALSLLFFVLYWVMMIGGEKIADRGMLPPFVSVWLPNVVLSLVGLFMLYRLTRSVGGSSR